MDLTPDLLLEAKFAPARRGYDMNEVDDFLERCAEGLDVLLARLRAEFDRAERAEAALAELRSGGDAPATPSADATVEAPVVATEPDPAPAAPAAAVEPERVQEPMRILIAAERTAEAAIADARAEAERIRAEAESVASTTRSEAETMLARSRAEAEAEARQAGEEARRSIEAEVLALRQDRDVLSEDVRSLRRWLEEQRGRLRTTAAELQRLVDDPEALRELPAPDGHDDGAQAESGDGEAPAAAAEPEVAPDAEPSAEETHDVVDARSAEETQARLPGSMFDDDEPTQAVPVVETSSFGPSAQTAVFDDERAPTNGAFFGSDTLR